MTPIYPQHHERREMINQGKRVPLIDPEAGRVNYVPYLIAAIVAAVAYLIF